MQPHHLLLLILEEADAWIQAGYRSLAPLLVRAVPQGTYNGVSSPVSLLPFFAKYTLVRLADGCPIASRGAGEGPCSEAESPAEAAL